MDSKKFANIYLSVCTILFLVGMLIIEHPPEEETISFDTPMMITSDPNVEHLVFEAIVFERTEITEGE